MTTRVVVAMSGGVDSSVAAALLLERGFDVVGVTMQLVAGELSGETIRDAKKVAAGLGIEHYVIFLRDYFQKEVIDYFIDEYLAGKTPNPCVVCNKKIKFGRLLAQAKRFGGSFLATGHYARVEKEDGFWSLKKGLDQGKDQSYTLYTLSQKQLEHIIFPLGDYMKEEVKKKAKELNLSVYNKPESQEICFIPDGKPGDYIKINRPGLVKGGTIVDEEGNEFGAHKGIVYYTVGQRRGLGLAQRHPVYVKKIEAKTNRLVVTTRSGLASTGLIAHKLNWVCGYAPAFPWCVEAKIRYNAPGVSAVINSIHGGEVRVTFNQPQIAVTPGQSVVFYEGESVLGGGIISASLSK